jgi:hypothetical protein
MKSLAAALAGMALAALCDSATGAQAVPAASQVQPRVPSPPDPTSAYLRQTPSGTLILPVLPAQTGKHRKHRLQQGKRYP